MKKFVLAAVLAVGAVALVTMAAVPAMAQQQTRSVEGQVTDHDSAATGSIVYLKNTKTLAVKTFIVDDKGMYRFNALSPNVDYELHAEKGPKKSDTRTLSSFDSRKEATINLHLK